VSRRPVALAALVVLAAGGCGGGGQSGTAGGGAATGAKVLFVRDCGACHRLAAAGTEGGVGADLDRARPSRAAVLQAIAEGPGAMPQDLVTGRDAQAVAAYVARVAGR
jgi:mono/diheme cytochrome c family protein